MSKQRVRFTEEAEDDLLRLFERDVKAAEQAVTAIRKAIELASHLPFACRKATADDPFLRELLITFGCSGFVALYRIERAPWSTVLAVRHQREDDYL